MSLALRPLELHDEEAAIRAWREFQKTPHGFLTFYEEEMPWPEYLRMLADHREGRNLPEGIAKHGMYVAIVDGELVGRAGIRFELNEALAFRYGHVGYGVIETQRRKGYATEILRQALVILADEGISPVLVTCWDHNVGSVKVIEKNGGQLESIAMDKEGVPFRRYWLSAQTLSPLRN